MRRVQGEGGQTTVLVVGLALVVFAVTGLAVDGTRAFLFRRTLQSLADAAAMAAAGEINSNTYYVSGGRDVRLDPKLADGTARRWLTQRGLHLQIDVHTDANHVEVISHGYVSPTFLSLLGVVRIPVAAQAVARPLAGTAP